MKQELKPPPLMPRFGLGDIVTVVGEYESDWGGQKLIITGIDYRPKQDLITYQTHLAEAPESEGGTDGWTETDLSLYQHNKWNTRSTPAPVTDEAIAEALDALKKCEWIEADISEGHYLGQCGYDCDDASDFLTKHHETIRTLLRAAAGVKP